MCMSLFASAWTLIFGKFTCSWTLSFFQHLLNRHHLLCVINSSHTSWLLFSKFCTVHMDTYKDVHMTFWKKTNRWLSMTHSSRDCDKTLRDGGVREIKNLEINGPGHFKFSYAALTCKQVCIDTTKYCPVRIRVWIGPPHPHACCKRWLNGAVLRMRPEKARSRVTAGVALKMGVCRDENLGIYLLWPWGAIILLGNDRECNLMIENAINRIFKCFAVGHGIDFAMRQNFFFLILLHVLWKYKEILSFLWNEFLIA
jgi:hypothetical protein